MKKQRSFQFFIHKENFKTYAHERKEAEAKGEFGQLYFVKDTIQKLIRGLQIKNIMPRLGTMLDESMGIFIGMPFIGIRVYHAFLELFEAATKPIETPPETLEAPVKEKELYDFFVEHRVPEGVPHEEDLLEILHSMSRIQTLMTSSGFSLPTGTQEILTTLILEEKLPMDHLPHEKREAIRKLKRSLDAKTKTLGHELSPSELKNIVLEYEKKLTDILNPSFIPPPDTLHTILDLFDLETLEGPVRYEIQVVNQIRQFQRGCRYLVLFAILLISGISFWYAWPFLKQRFLKEETPASAKPEEQKEEQKSVAAPTESEEQYRAHAELKRMKEHYDRLAEITHAAPGAGHSASGRAFIRWPFNPLPDKTVFPLAFFPRENTHDFSRFLEKLSEMATFRGSHLQINRFPFRGREVKAFRLGGIGKVSFLFEAEASKVLPGGAKRVLVMGNSGIVLDHAQYGYCYAELGIPLKITFWDGKDFTSREMTEEDSKKFADAISRGQALPPNFPAFLFGILCPWLEAMTKYLDGQASLLSLYGGFDQTLNSLPTVNDGYQAHALRNERPGIMVFSHPLDDRLLAPHILRMVSQEGTTHQGAVLQRFYRLGTDAKPRLLLPHSLYIASEDRSSPSSPEVRLVAFKEAADPKSHDQNDPQFFREFSHSYITGINLRKVKKDSSGKERWCGTIKIHPEKGNQPGIPCLGVDLFSDHQSQVDLSLNTEYGRIAISLREEKGEIFLFFFDGKTLRRVPLPYQPVIGISEIEAETNSKILKMFYHRAPFVVNAIFETLTTVHNTLAIAAAQTQDATEIDELLQAKSGHRIPRRNP